MRGSLRVAVLPGDGIGREVTPAALAVMSAAVRAAGAPPLGFEVKRAGAQAFLDTGTALSDAVVETCEKADAIYLGAMGLPRVRNVDGTEIAPDFELRSVFELYAGLRPIRTIPGVPSLLNGMLTPDVDFAVVRESTGGHFGARCKGVVETDEIARDEITMTRRLTERVSRFAFEEAMRRAADRARAATVTLVDKADLLVTHAFMRTVFDEVAQRYRGIGTAHLYLDAAMLALLTRPSTFDVILTESLLGELLSTVTAAIVGGPGFTPSADIGDDHALFQPAHGSEPEIAGSGRANPTAAILSGAMLLDWLGDRHETAPLNDAARLIENAVDESFGSGALQVHAHGGSDGVREVTNEILDRLEPPKGGRR
ncbi:isocitrate/isopropylmalate family dehydrogenase [Acuticoccus sp. M5D2P5]|uniref:isocitrate/isopropylmalate family dehydrogenase n=1 Tax=Acuticoccus kalidii TaxID=2910977 RepID=UPI001F3B2FDD|nr:isocitrate/isopropylmalate family dehydrogenase [Acuticoccus kalidii]MCF3932315.1 isocitrate/isopropylmalate family dehydrogenase [Acuticoccus kalidii]